MHKPFSLQGSGVKRLHSEQLTFHNARHTYANEIVSSCIFYDAVIIFISTSSGRRNGGGCIRNAREAEGTLCTSYPAKHASHPAHIRPISASSRTPILHTYMTRCNYCLHHHTHRHTLALTLQGWNLMECDLVWRLGVGPLICMQAVFTGIPWPIIIINPDWGIGTPNLTGLYGYSHSRRTGATLYYIL